MEHLNRNYVAWKKCAVCTPPPLGPNSSITTTSHNHYSPRQHLSFKSPREFTQHLRDFHCKKEGGSFVCRYGTHGVCPSLPVEGVSDRDYEDHVARDHVAGDSGSRSSGSRSPTPPVRPSQPNIVEDQHKWTVFNAQVNLPAVLNDPRLAKRETDFFSKTWGESFERTSISSSPFLPKINKQTFDKYLQKIGPRYKRHVKSLSSDDNLGERRESLDAFPMLHGKILDKSKSDLDQVPKIFLQQSFSLENMDTFNTVFPWSQIESSRPNSSKPRQSSKLLQEKLSHYLDIIEVQIARQISMRSDAFFHAMTSQDKLNDHMFQTCAAIKCLRDKIHTLDAKLVKGPLEIMKRGITRSNYVRLNNKLKLMSTVHQTQPTIQMLLATNEFVGALDLISTTQEVLTQELAGVTCFRHLGSQLAEMEKLIEKMMHEDFVRFVSSDLNRVVEEGTSIMDQDRLVCILLGLLRQHRSQFIEIYRDEAYTTLKAVLKQTVIMAVSEADDVDTEGNVGSLADQMRLLNYALWMELLDQVFKNLLVIINRAKSFYKVVLEVINMSSANSKSETFSQHSDSDDEQKSICLNVDDGAEVMITDDECSRVRTGVKDMLGQICDQAHDRCVKLLTARSKDQFLEKLSSSEFVRLSRSIERFVTDCAVICGRRSTSLRGCLQSQANKFVNRFHEERKTKLSLILDNERWKQADVPYEFQQIVSHITKSDRLIPLDSKLLDNDKKPSDFLEVNGETYAVVGTVLMLLRIVLEYCQCVEDIPSAVPDILSRLIELLKIFNSRSCQLVLGAGALQLVGLKTISTKNLALASRCLQLIVLYIPKVKVHFEKLLQGKQVNMLKHFDQVEKDYKDHIDEISNKLVTIMESMITMHLGKWEVKAPMPSPCFRALSKQMLKLNEAIADILPSSQVRNLLMRIHQSFKRQLNSQLKRLNVSNDNGPQHGLVTSDLAFYMGNLKSIPCMMNIEDNTNDIWR